MARWCCGVEINTSFNWSIIHDAILMGVGITLTYYDPDNLDFGFSNWMGDEVYLHLNPINEERTHIYIESKQGMETPFEMLNRSSQEDIVDSIADNIEQNIYTILSRY